MPIRLKQKALSNQKKVNKNRAHKSIVGTYFHNTDKSNRRANTDDPMYSIFNFLVFEYMI